MLNFGQKVEEKSNDVIPKDALLWAVINLREIKNSRESNGRYLDIELTIADNQPYARRKIWTMIADPFDANNSEEWRAMGYGAIRRILEAVKGATPDNANSYTLAQLHDLHGLMVPIITTIEKGKDGYDDKNKCEFLSPYSSVKKIVEGFRLLQTGVYTMAKETKAPAAPTAGSLFTGTATPPPANMVHNAPPAAAQGGPAPGWLAPAVTPGVVAGGAAPAAGGYTAPQQSFPAGQPAVPTQAHTHAGLATVAPAPGTAPSAPQGHAAPPAQTSPSNGGWAPPGAAPAQFPGQS